MGIYYALTRGLDTINYFHLLFKILERIVSLESSSSAALSKTQKKKKFVPCANPIYSNPAGQPFSVL